MNNTLVHSRLFITEAPGTNSLVARQGEKWGKTPKGNDTVVDFGLFINEVNDRKKTQSPKRNNSECGRCQEMVEGEEKTLLANCLGDVL